jgi:TPR repeat protein
MSEKDNFALVRKASSAVEKAAPGAKRILSGMVADSLALASSKEVTVSDEQVENWFQTGLKHHFGQGVTRNAAEAVKWYRKAAKQKHANAQCNLGCCYVHGEGVAKDSVEAVKWFRKAANQNYADAQYNLGVFYQDGEGVEKDYAEAGKWFRRAAEQGHRTAQESLGACYANGRVAIAIEDAVDAYKYVKIAEEKGFEGAAKTVDLLSVLLSPEELREAERRYQELNVRRN